MRKHCKVAVACFLALALLAALCSGCAEEKEELRTITIGEITDLTGPSAPACIPMHRAMEDLVKYYNEEGLIPGAKLRLVTYDSHMDPARYVPGYDWLKERGADLILAAVTGAAETIRPFAEEDRIPIPTVAHSKAAVEPPGWVFVLTAPIPPQVKTLLKWLSENDWDYDAQEIPKLGFYGWQEPISIGVDAAIKEYCQAYPDEYDYVGGFLAPVGSMTCSGEVEKLKDCDYVFGSMFMGAVLINEYCARGYDAQFIADSGSFGFYEFMVERAGWENLDGYITTMVAPCWDEENAAVAFIKEVVDRYHPGEGPEDMGGAYHGAFFMLLSIFEIVGQAVEEVGIEAFDGQAFYDAAAKFNMQYEGLPEYYFTDTERCLLHECAIYEWSAADEELVRLTDWLPLVE
ncbi:MAG: ABC transporter substrate-binding protein [Dehalococcoidia bacterium]|nr:ABC transporter substrate-binding protein [Dehalococcoidia bacterium]